MIKSYIELNSPFLAVSIKYETSAKAIAEIPLFQRIEQNKDFSLPSSNYRLPHSQLKTYLRVVECGSSINLVVWAV